MSTTLNIILLAIIFLVSNLGAQPTEDPRFTESLRALENKDYLTSLKILIPLVSENPQRPLYWFNLATTQFMLKKYVPAVAGFDKVIALNREFADVAVVYKAKSLKKLGLHDSATDHLEKLLTKPLLTKSARNLAMSELSKLDEIAELEDQALIKYKAGKWDNCESILATIDLEDLSLNGRLLMGLSLIKQKKFAESERHFKTQLKILRLSPQNRQLFVSLLNKSRQADKTNVPVWLFLETSYGTNSNVYFDGLSTDSLSTPVLKGTIGTGYHFNSQKNDSQKIGYTYNYEEPTKATELKSSSHTLQASAHMDRVSKTYSATSYYILQNYGNTLVSDKLGLNLKSIFTFENTDWVIEGDLSRQEPKNNTFDFLSGNALFLRPAFGFWGDSTYGQIYLSLGQDLSKDITYSDGSLLPVSQDYYGLGFKGVWKFSFKGILSGGFLVTQHKYKNPSEPGQKIRSDKETNSFLKLSYFVYPKFVIYLLGEQTNNTSNLGPDDIRDKNYKVNVLTTGFIWDVY